MRRALLWIWQRGIVSTFLAGLFVVLPLAITIAIMSWVADTLGGFIGPESLVGHALHSVGLKLVAHDTIATVVGWALVLAGIWLLGLLVRSTARYRLEEMFHRALNRVPLLGTIYGPVAQVVRMLQRQEHDDLKAMSVVYCTFGEQEGGAFLTLLASEKVYRFGEQDCYLIFLPTSPFPMTGGLVFVPTGAVRKVDMGVEELMQIYFSLGIMAGRVVPPRYQAPSPPAGNREPARGDAT
jgi:uncharacterized membrane protein